jgi:hypothetical protein
MKILDFYKQLSSILEDYREESISKKNAIESITNLNKLAKDGKLDINRYIDILDNIEIYDDERSYEVQDTSSYNSSYDSDIEESSESSESSYND